MHILMLTNDYPPLVGGIATHVYNLSRSIAEKGHRVSVIVPDCQGASVIKKDSGVSVIRENYKPSKIRAIRLKRITQAVANGTKKAVGKNGRFDLIHQHDARATKLAAMEIRNNLQVPLVWTYHSFTMLRPSDRLSRMFLRSIKFKSEGMIAVSPENHKAAQHFPWNNGKMKMITNGVDPQVYNKKVREHKKFTVLCPGRMVPLKDTITLAKAIPLLVRKHPHIKWKFIFLGSSPFTNTNKEYINEIKSILSDPEFSECVQFQGNLSQQQMPVAYQAADLVIVSSLKETINLCILQPGAAHSIHSPSCGMLQSIPPSSRRIPRRNLIFYASFVSRQKRQRTEAANSKPSNPK